MVLSYAKLRDDITKKETIIINFAWHIKKEIRKYLKKQGLKNKVIEIL